MKQKLFIIFTGVVFCMGCFFVFLIFSQTNKSFSKVQASLKSQEEKLPSISNQNQNNNFSLTLAFFGDVMLDRDVRVAIEKKGFESFFFESGDLFSKADENIANLEGPVADNASVSVGTKPDSNKHFTFVFDPLTLKTLKEKNFQTLFLGNNHILNHGKAGLEQTQKNLDQNQIAYFGQPGAPEYLSLEIKGVQYALVGYNAFEADSHQKTLNWIKEAKAKNNLVIVFTHWGSEYKTVPNETQKQLAHKFIENGADVIIGTHPHVVQSIEKYQGKMIFYSLGNFIFDQFFSDETKTGLNVILKIDADTQALSYDLRFFSIDGSFKIKPLPEEKQKVELEKLANISEISLDEKDSIRAGEIK